MMRDLFNDHDPNTNYLPYDGTVRYWGSIFTAEQCNDYYQQLLSSQIAWKNDEAIIYGKHIVTGRKVALYGDSNYQYRYSGTRRNALPWNDLLLAIKAHVEEKTAQRYNSCLLNLYHDGQEGMAWHSDDEKDLLPNGSIASLSFGATRKFALKHKMTQYKHVFELHSGDLLEMKDETQSHWLHNVPTTKKVFTPRISLTFRQMVR